MINNLIPYLKDYRTWFWVAVICVLFALIIFYDDVRKW